MCQSKAQGGMRCYSDSCSQYRKYIASQSAENIMETSRDIVLTTKTIKELNSKGDSLIAENQKNIIDAKNNISVLSSVKTNVSSLEQTIDVSQPKYKKNNVLEKAPEVADEWNYEKNYPLRPEHVSFSSHIRAYFTCPKCGNVYQARITDKTYYGSKCRLCVEFGFQPSKPSIFYFIIHTEKKARKIGITNVSATRMAWWKSQGWEIIATVEDETGVDIAELETRMKTYVRDENGLPQALTKEEIGVRGGHTETFPVAENCEVSDEEILNTIDLYWADLKG
jgi:hypothetical protein